MHESDKALVMLAFLILMPYIVVALLLLAIIGVLVYAF